MNPGKGVIILLIHIVQKGDNLYALSKRYGLAMQKIIDDNSIKNPERLMIGQALVIDTDRLRHTVAAGESLYKIAQSYGVTVDNLLQSNREITDPARIYTGQMITIPLNSEKSGTIEVNGYAFPNIGSNTLSKTLPYLTYLSPFSHQVRADGTLGPLAVGSLVQKAREGRVAPLLVITNIKTGGGFDSSLAHTILSSTQLQDTLLDNIIKALNNGYYGLDIDFEYIYPQDREEYNRFLRKAVNRLHALGYIVSTALAPKISSTQRGILYEGHDYPVHGSLVDHVILMTYEWGYTYGPPQAVAPIDQVEKVIKYAVSVIPNRKILMGIPNYGYDWTLPFVQGTAARSLSNTAAIDLAVREGAAIQYDSQSQAPFFNYNDEEGRRHIVWFEDARSIKAKLTLVSKYNLGGVSYWTINSFFPQNWLVLSSMFNIRKVL